APPFLSDLTAAASLRRLRAHALGERLVAEAAADVPGRVALDRQLDDRDAHTGHDGPGECLAQADLLVVGVHRDRAARGLLPHDAQRLARREGGECRPAHTDDLPSDLAHLVLLMPAAGAVLCRWCLRAVRPAQRRPPVESA